jgi:acetyl-CoA C-acetyltransferase
VNREVAVIGTYQSKFRTHHPDLTYVEQAQEAAVGALRSAGMSPDDIDAIVFSLAPTSFLGVADADRWAIDHIFGAGKPVFRVHTGGATGGSAVHAAYNLVRAGLANRVLIVGAERIAETPDAQKVLNLIFDAFYERDMPLSTNTSVALQASRYMKEFDLHQEDLARVVVRARRNAMRNPSAHLKGEITVDEVMQSPVIAYPLKLFDICPRSSGGAAMVVASQAVAERHCERPAFINGIASITETYWLGDRLGPTSRHGYANLELMRVMAQRCFAQAGIRDPLRQIQVTELYDPYSTIGAMTLEQLGFCSPGTALRLERQGHWSWENGAVAVNPSGGTLCTNPIAITGLVRAIDAANQVMGRAGEMQRPDVKAAVSTAIGGIAQFCNCTVFGSEPVIH